MIIYRMTVSIDRVCFLMYFPLTASLPMQMFALQEEVVMNLDSRLLIFPLYICCNFLYTSPEKKADGEALPDNSET